MAKRTSPIYFQCASCGRKRATYFMVPDIVWKTVLPPALWGGWICQRCMREFFNKMSKAQLKSLQKAINKLERLGKLWEHSYNG